MPNYEIQISPQVKVEFSSEKSMSNSVKSIAAITSLLKYSQNSLVQSDIGLNIANNYYSFRYRIITSRVINRAMTYSDAIKYIKSRRGIDFDEQLADYAVRKLLEALDRG
jgi:hypothetical protein